MVDPYSLDQLQDIAEPAPLPWWPPAPGWYYVFALLSIWTFVFLFRAWQRWRANAYRRQAMSELEKLPQGDLVGISTLLKRVALVAYPRRRVASLSGTTWTDFLSQTCQKCDFSHGEVAKIGTAAYVDANRTCDPSTWQEVYRVSKVWISHHVSETSHEPEPRR